MSVNSQLLGINSAWYNGVQPTIPDEYVLPTPFPSIRLTRRSVKRDVDTAMPVTPNNRIIRWKIPTNSNIIYDFRRAKVIINFSVGVTAPWLARPSTLAWNIVDRFRLEQNSNYVEDRRFFNLQETMSYVVQTHINQQITTGVALYGDGSMADRNARAGGWKYVLPIPTTGLTKGIMPWFQILKDGAIYKTQGMPDTFLQWELIAPEQFVEVYGAAPGTPVVGLTWTVTRMRVEYEEIYAEGGNGELLKNWMNKSRLAFLNGFPRIFYRRFVTNTYPVTTATEQMIPIDFKLSSLISIFVTFRFTTETNDPTVYGKQQKYLSRTTFNLSEYQWDINGSLWPDQPIPLDDAGIAEAYAKYLESWQMFHGRGIQQEVTPITIDQFLNDKFLLVFDGNQHPFTQQMLNPISTQYSSNSIQMKLKFAVAPPANLEAVVHIFHWACWNFGSRGAVPIVEQ